MHLVLALGLFNRNGIGERTGGFGGNRPDEVTVATVRTRGETIVFHDDTSMKLLGPAAQRGFFVVSFQLLTIAKRALRCGDSEVRRAVTQRARGDFTATSR